MKSRSESRPVPSPGRRRERGQNIIEFALLFPLLLFLVFGIIDFALLFFSYNTIGNAAREGARYGIIDDTFGNVNTAARAITTGLDPARVTVTSTGCVAGTVGERISVTVTYDHQMVTGTWLTSAGSGTIQLSTTSTMNCEQ